MAANPFTVVGRRADTIRINFTITRTNTLTGTTAPVDLTGSTLWFTAKNKVGDTDAAAVFQKLSTAGAILLTNPTGGICQVVIAPADTVTLADHDVDLYADLQLKEADGTYTTVANGTLTVQPDITRAS